MNEQTTNEEKNLSKAVLAGIDTGEYDAEGAAVFLTLGTEATSYRAVSGRKLSLKSTVNIGACVKCNRNILYYGDGCGEIEKKMQTVSATVIKAVADREFSFEESITLPREYLPCSEIIDCDAYTGGFNLQIAFSTAFAAGTAAAGAEL